MRLLILAAGAALALSACGNNDQSATTRNIDENLTAENIVANDVTAIDAVTADAANMAADVDINFTNATVEPGGNTAESQPKPRGARPSPEVSPEVSRRPSAPASSPPAEAPASNATD